MTNPSPSYVTVLAIAHPPGRSNDLNGEGLSVEDIRRITESKAPHRYPIFMEHYREFNSIGEIIRTHLGPGDTLGIVALLDVNTIAGAMVYRMLKAHEFVGLSVQVKPFMTDSFGIEKKRLLEVSFTKYPKLSQTGVLFISDMLFDQRDSDLQKEYDLLFRNYKGSFIFCFEYFFLSNFIFF